MFSSSHNNDPKSFSSSLFLFGNNTSQTPLFGQKSSLPENNTTSQTSLFGQKSSLSENNNTSQTPLFGQKSNLFGNNNTSQTSIFGQNINNNLFFPRLEEEKRKNKQKNLSFQCNHVNKYVAYNAIDIDGPICYNCIHKYYIKTENCIPFEESIDYYKEIYQNYLNLLKETINNKFTEFLEEIEKLNVDKFDNFYVLLNNLELNFELPIEVSLEERIEIGINKKLLKMVKNLNHKINEELPHSFLNLYETKLKDLKTKNSYSYDQEKFILKSEIPFTLVGIAIPKVSKELNDNIKFSIESFGGLFGSIDNKIEKVYIKESKIKNNLTIIKFEKPLEIKSSIEYQMSISGINGLTYIDNEEKYNLYSKISIKSDNKESILACLIIQ